MTLFTYDFVNFIIEPDTFPVDMQELGNSIKVEMSKLENLGIRTFWFWTGNTPVGSFGGLKGLDAQMIGGWTIKWAAQGGPTNAEIFGGVIGDELGDPPFSNIPADNIFPTRSIDRTPAKPIPVAGGGVGSGSGRTLDK